MSALCISASAASIEDTAKAIDSGKKVSFTPEVGTVWGAPSRDYKVVLSEKGTLRLTFNTRSEKTCVEVMDSNGKKIKCSDSDVTTGSIISSWGTTSIYWNKNVEKFSGKLYYKSLKKGTYYVRIYNTNSSYDVNGKLSVSFKYPQATTDNEETGTISALSITLKKGETLQLGAVIKGEGTVEWTSSKKSVASVNSDGKITAKSKGSATIQAKLGSSSVKININVTE